MNHYPMTKDQRDTLDQDLARIMENPGDIAGLLRAGYSEKDHSVSRVEESRAAVQRLIWALERQPEAQRAGA
jgi:hypothetical protein